MGALSAVSCVAYFIPFVLRLGGIVVPAWNFVLFILWTAVFGIFGKVGSDTPLTYVRGALTVDAVLTLCRCTSTRTLKATAASDA